MAGGGEGRYLVVFFCGESQSRPPKFVYKIARAFDKEVRAQCAIKNQIIIYE